MKLLRVNRHVDSDGTHPLREVLPDASEHPFIREIMERHRFDVEFDVDLLHQVRVRFWDEDYWKADPTWEIFASRADFFEEDAPEDELAAAFVHEIYHILDGRYPEDPNYLEDPCERDALNEELAYLRTLGWDEARVNAYVRRHYSVERP